MSVEIWTDNPIGDILIVDDVPENLRLLMDLLRMAGHSVRPANGGEVALRSAFAKPPDVILLDIRMPGMDGYEVCHALKSDARTQDIPVLFISGLGATLDKVKGFTTGGVDYITKPFEAEEVLARVKTHVLLRHALQRLKAQNEALAEAQETLERRVEERTRALQASEAHHRAITRSAVDGILALDHEWRVTSWNLAAARLFGWVEEEMLGETPKRLVREEEHEALMLGLKWLLREGAFYGGNKSLGVNALHRSGARRPIEISLSSWESEGRPAYAVTVRDLRED